MNEVIEQPEQPVRATEAPGDAVVWQTPDYTVVDTALEVTAYSLTAR
ncbi:MULTISPECIES: pyrroloquinoline quinone precursor peptide PqqA [Streptomyces]|nr:pyrroloquinoline quinone precursor peptide PqqA [Streptomyces durhamensis]